MTGAQVKSVFYYLVFCILWDLLVREITINGPLPRPSVTVDFVLGLQAAGWLLGLLMFGDFYVITLCPTFLNQSSHPACCFQAGYLFLFSQQVPSAAVCVPPEVWNCGEEGSGATVLRDSLLSSASSVVLSCSVGGRDSSVTQGPYRRKGS